VDVQIADGVSIKLTVVRLESFLPILLHGLKQVRVKTDVVESDIPLLLLRSAMKKAGQKWI
jgi:hypothetical protein